MIRLSCYSKHIRNIFMLLSTFYVLNTFQTEVFHHRLTKRELKHVFGVRDDSQIPVYTLVKTENRLSRDGEMSLSFKAWDSTYRLELAPNQRLISPYLSSVIREGNETRVVDGLPKNLRSNCHFYGKVVSHGNVSATVSNCESLMGTIIMNDHFLVLQDIPRRLRHNQVEQHIVYKRQAGLLMPWDTSSYYDFMHLMSRNDSNSEFCDIGKSIDEPLLSIKLEGEHPFSAYEFPVESSLDSFYVFPKLDLLTIELALFLDAKLYEHFSREYDEDAEQHLLDFSLALINNVHMLYQQSSLAPNIEIVIVRYELWKTQPIGLDTNENRNGHARLLLNLFSQYQAFYNAGTDLLNAEHWDHAVLLTGYDLYYTTTAVAGVATIGQMCHPVHSASLVEGVHLGRSFVLAHEMGHNMGMTHDGEHNMCNQTCCLMSPVNGAGRTTWSPCSLRELNAFLSKLDLLQGNCLRDRAVGLSGYNHQKDGRLPGQRYTADQQCSYFYGRDFQLKLPPKRKMSEICRVLWCGNEGSARTSAHPALEGTYCGNGRKFCVEGKCRKWSHGTAPEPVDGQWSQWFGDEETCPIFQCRISGSIHVKGQLRTCTNPAANNGGRPCPGSSVRGIVCDQPIIRCEQHSKEAYGSIVCKEAQSRGEIPDSQLNGSALMHDSQPCKVWCHLKDSVHVRNKGVYPDGSPCGVGKYCISGSCLSLSCNDSALVDDPSQCPPQVDLLSFGFSQWSKWSRCSCAKESKQSRIRSCDRKPCFGQWQQTQSCKAYSTECDSIDYLTSWSSWTSCSVTCGSGDRSRTRECQAADCAEKLNETKKCKEEACPSWLQWSAWFGCSVSCGHGHQKRTRSCTLPGNCTGESIEIEPCEMKECTTDFWGSWQDCSVSCGIGIQIRERKCGNALCKSGEKQARACNKATCDKDAKSSEWSDWSEWSACSASCGEGIRFRIQTCLKGTCAGLKDRKEQRICVLRPCPQWSDWLSWTNCTSCSTVERRSRQRYCKAGIIRSGQTNFDCPGSSVEHDRCDRNCSMIIHTLSNKSVIEWTSPSFSEEKDQHNIIWEDWQTWQPCSVTCGGGARVRIRICKSYENCQSTGLQLNAEACQQKPCVDGITWSEWTDWSPCSATCGDGMQKRRRKCKAQFIFLCSGPSKEERDCAQTPCSETVFDQQIITKVKHYEDSKPKWSDWSDWSKCSCFTMKKFRRRYCEVNDPSLQGFCTGPLNEEISCVPEKCVSENGGWAIWGSWSKCSSECGSKGHRMRNRMCANPVPSNRGSYCIGYSFDQEECFPSKSCSLKAIDGSWTAWTEWSTCVNNCSSENRSRTRFCANPQPRNGGSNCQGTDFEHSPCERRKDCTKSVDGSWSEWTAWSDCTAECGFSFKSAHRYCSSPRPYSPGKPCLGFAHMTTICEAYACKDAIDGMWSSWSEWSKCSGICGEKTRNRKRDCESPSPINGGYPCIGRSMEVSKCGTDLVDDKCWSFISHTQQLDLLDRESLPTR